MAKGRFVSKEITLDKRVNDLSDDTSRLGFTWLITHLDCEGRTYGDSAIVKSLIFPRRCDVTTDMVETYIQEWCAGGLCIRYEARGDLYIEFPNFDKHQVGLRKEREPSSTIPANIRQTSGKHPAEVKLSKVNDKLIQSPLAEEKSFVSIFLDKLQISINTEREREKLKDLLSNICEDKLLKISDWYIQLPDRSYVAWRVLGAIQSAAENWTDTPAPPRKNERDEMMAALEANQKEFEKQEVTNGN